MSVPQKGDLRPGELRVVLLAGLYSFFLFASYYPLRALRDAFGAGQPKELHWLFTGTLLVTLIVQPLYGWLVSKRGRAAFIPISYRFLLLNAVAFGLLLDGLEGEALTWAQRAFFVWLSAYIQFAVTVFWGFLADLMGSPRARRLYGRIAIGSTLGAMTGSAFASLDPEQLEALAARIGLAGWARPSLILPLFSAVLLECAVRAARAVERVPLAREPEDPDSDALVPVGGRALDGFRDVLRSRHLLGICLYVMLFVLGSTMLYYINSVVTKAAYGPEERTAFFARMDFAVNALTLVFQLFVTGKLLQRLGLGVALAAVPLVSVLAFGTIALAPTLIVIGCVHVLRRSLEFGLSKPAREALFTVLARDEKYKAKAVIDTVVYRGGDAGAMWLQAALTTGLGVSTAALAWGMMPLCALAVVLSLALGREHARRARAITAAGEGARLALEGGRAAPLARAADARPGA